jgi:hypothetical protein
MGRPWKLVRVPAPDASGIACCKCGYDLTTIAEPPPEKSPPSVNCPECGSPVRLRESVWTDGRHPLGALLVISCLSAIAVTLSIFAVAGDNGLMNWARDAGWPRPILLPVGIVPMLSLMMFGPLFFGWLGSRGSSTTKHQTARGYLVASPFIVLFMLYMTFGRAVFDWIGS